MHVDEHPVSPLPWWFPPLLLLALLFIWPLMVEVVGTQPPDGGEPNLINERISGWNAAYGEALESSAVRTITWKGKGTRAFLLDTPWAKAFPGRMLVLSLLWTVLALAAARNPRGIPIPTWMTWTTWSVALFPWVYLLLSAGAGRGYGEVIAARLDRLAQQSTSSTVQIPISSPPTEIMLALGALVAILLVLLLIELRGTGRIPTLADLLRLELDTRDPGRVLHGLPKMQRHPEVFLAPVAGSSNGVPYAEPTGEASSSEPAVD